MTPSSPPGHAPEPHATAASRHPARAPGRPLPLAIRKEILLTRAALERHDCAQARNDVRQAAGRTLFLSSLGALLPSLARRPHPLLTRALDAARHRLSLPGAIASLAYTGLGLRRLATRRTAWRLGKIGLLAGIVWWGYRAWQAPQPPRTRREAGAASHRESGAARVSPPH